MKPTCTECGAPLRGRTDKKFCGDMCRTSHHNKKMQQKNKLIKNTISILTKNREVLNSISEKGDIFISIEVVNNKGFRKEYFTHHRTLENTGNYKCCFEFGIKEIDSNKIEVINFNQLQVNQNSFP